MFSLRSKTSIILLLLAILIIPLAVTGLTADEKPNKIPIEQAIRESHQAHDECRLHKAERLQRNFEMFENRNLKGALPTQYQYDVLFYDINILIDESIQRIYGDVAMTARATEDGVTFCQIDLESNMTVDSVTVNGSTAAYTFSGDLITATLPATVNTDETFTVTVYYNGQPQASGFQAFSFSSYGGNPVISTLSEPYAARTWWPCKDYPDDKADSMDINITYNNSLFCASNGTLISDVSNLDGTRTAIWRVRYPMATYLFSLAISNYSTWREYWSYGDIDSMPVDYWVYPSKLAAAQSGWAPTRDMLTALSNAFGPYPFSDEKYAMSMFNWGGAMEHQTNSSMNYNATYQSINAHEMAHQWWGDLITCRDWHHIWMNEGFASYSEALWFESQGDFQDLRDYMQGMRYTSGGSIYRTDTTDVWGIFSGIVYDKGAWVLHMLRNVVTDSVFNEIMHTYYDSEYKFGDITTEDFRDICETVSGVELDDFYQDWIYGQYYPRYAVSWDYEQTSANSYDVYVHVRQYQTTNPTVFHMPQVDLSVFNGSWNDFRVPMNSRDVDYVLTLTNTTSAPVDVEIDRNDWILKNATSESYSVHILTEQLPDGDQFQSYSEGLLTKGGSEPYQFQILSGTLPAGLILDSQTGVISGTATEFGDFQVTIEVNDNGSGSDSKLVQISITEAPYINGDADGSGAVDISDAVYLIAYIFGGGPAPIPLEAGDADGSCAVDISDAVYLIAYIFGGGPAPQAGC